MRLVDHLLLCGALIGYTPAGEQLQPPPHQAPSPLADAVLPTVQGKATGYVLVTRGAATLLARGFGSASGDIPPPSRDTAFDIASMSKLFTAVAVLRLVDRGRLDLDISIRRYLPELPATLQDVTLRRALQHEGGFPAYLSGDDLTQKSPAEVIAEISAMPRDRPAGSGFLYSDIGYVLAALIMERVTATNFRNAMRRLVFRPAGLTGTGFYGEPWDSRRAAAVFVNGVQRGSPATFRFTYNFAGSGQIATTADDLRRLFMRSSSGSFLSQRSRTLLFSPGVGTAGRLPYRTDGLSDVTYSFGLFHFRDRRGRLAHAHGGASELGGHGFIYWRPGDRLFVAGLFNSGHETFGRGAFMRAILEAAEPIPPAL